MEEKLLPDDNEGVYTLVSPDEPPAYILLAYAKGDLAQTDYQTLKWLDGELTDEEYEPIRIRRAELRERVRALEPASVASDGSGEGAADA